MENKIFEFTYTIIKIRAEIIDSLLTIKQGLKTYKVEIENLKYLYVINHEGIGQEMLLAYDDFTTGKLKKIRINGDLFEPGFKALIEELIKRKPDIDIRTMPLNEAHKLMKAVNVVKIIPLILVLIVVGIFVIIFLPSILHGLDKGEQVIDASELYSEYKLKTSNLMVKGYPLLDFAMIEETTDEDSTTVENFIPIVPYDWDESIPVRLILKTGDLSEDEFYKIENLDSIPCVVRNILFEQGVTKEQKDFFISDIGLEIANDVLLLEYMADTEFEFIFAIIIISTVFFIIVIIAIVVARMQRKANP